MLLQKGLAVSSRTMELQQVVTVFSTTVPDEKLCVGATRLDFSTPTTPEILSATAVALPAARPE